MIPETDNNPVTDRTIESQTTESRDCGDCGSARFCALRRFSLDQADGLATPQSPIPVRTQIFRQGATLESLFLVRAGAVKTTRVAPDGTEQVTGFYLPGHLFGLDSLAEQCHTEGAITLSTTSLCEIRIQDLNTSNLSSGATMAMCSELLEDRNRLIACLTRSADQRVASLLANLAARFIPRGLAGSSSEPPMSPADIANYLNLSHETVSRVFTRLEQAGLVSANRRQVQIPDPVRLSTFSEQDGGLVVSKAA